MAIQGVKVEVAFTTTPFADPGHFTWTDISAFVHDVDIQRGRQYELAQQQAGVCTVQFDNLSGNFDPDNVAGAYYPLVVPLTPIRVTSLFSATTYPLFYGYIESWVQTQDAARRSLCTVTASDGIKALLAYAMGIGYTEFVVQDYGGTIGGTFDHYWPFTYVGSALPSQLNYYGGPGGGVALINTNNDFFLNNGIALTCFQLIPPSSWYWWQVGAPGARGYWCGFEGWLRIDTLPAAGSQPGCLVFNGNKFSGGPVTPWQGFGANAYNDSMSVYVTQNPKNLCAVATADPTSATGWATTAGTLAVVAAATTNAMRRIYLDNGTTDFYGATDAMRLTTTVAGSSDWTTPFITGITAGSFHTFQVVLTQENAIASSSFLTVDWYNGAALLSSTTLAGPLSTAAFAPTVFAAFASAPASTTQCKLHWQINASAGTSHFDMAQINVVLGAFTSLPWYAGQSTPARQIGITVAGGAGTAPPGQGNSTTGWACYGVATSPVAGQWILVDIDSGSDNTATPYSGTTATRGMPKVWINGVTVRLWTPGDATGGPLAGTFNASCYAGIGAALYGGGTSPTVNAGSEIAMSFDELYVADQNIAVVGEVTAAKALSHYNYSLGAAIRHDFFEQTTGFRMWYVLVAMGWPSTLASVNPSIDFGQRNIQQQLPQVDSTSTTAVSLLEDANNVEGGLYFVAASGVFTFFDSAHVLASTAELLTANDQGFEGGVGSWLPDATSFNAGNCTATQSTTFAHSGTHSLRLSSLLSSGPQNAVTGLYPVTAGQPYTATVWARAGTTPETAVVRINWYNAALTLLLGVAGFVSDAVGSWTQVTLAGQVAPAGAVWATLGCETGVAGVGELHYFDDFTLTGPVPSATFGDRPDLGEIPYLTGPTVSKDDTYIYNYAVASKTITDGVSTAYTSPVAQDATSQGQYKTRNTSLSAPWFANADVDAAAASLVATFKSPSTRIANISIDGVKSGAFATLLGLDLGALVQTNIRPNSAGPTIANAVFIQGLHLHITPNSWQFDYSLAPHLFSR